MINNSDRMPAVWMFFAWAWIFVIGLWFHWQIPIESAWFLVYWAAKLMSYVFAFVTAVIVLNA